MNTIEPLIFELSRPGRRGFSLPAPDVPDVPDAGAGAEAGSAIDHSPGHAVGADTAVDPGPAAWLPAGRLRAEPPALPEVAEVDVVRHFTRLSQLNHAVDTGFYPLGSCTMKYSPRVNEDAARLPGFAGLHPHAPDDLAQGALQLMWELARYLAEIGGMDRVTLQPAAGAHGELVGMLVIRAYHEQRGERRGKVLVPDSAHGTNPATARMCGFDVVTVRSDDRGGVDLGDLERVLDGDVAALMLTNPNTLGLFDENIHLIARLVHDAGGLLYYDGANANAILGVSRPGDMGFDVVHFNLHKTFSTPHGGGGPGAGAVGVKPALAPFLPAPLVERAPDGRFFLQDNLPLSIGRVHAFHGNFAVLVRAYTYIRMLGPEGLRRVGENAVLNANYLLRRLWLPPADDLLPADRGGSPDDRADGDGEQGDPGPVRGGDDRDRRAGPHRAGEGPGRPLYDGGGAPGRGAGGAAPGAVLARRRR